MHALDDLTSLESAEDFFEHLGVSFDAVVLAASRLHLLRAFGAAMGEIDARSPLPGPAERRALYADALRRAHDLYAHANGPRAFTGRCGACEVAAGCAGHEEKAA